MANRKALPKALPTVRELLDSPCTSDWLKASLRSALYRDCVDASHDAELLAMVLGARADDMLGVR